MKKTLYGVYDTQDNYVCVGVFNSIELEKYFNRELNSLLKSIWRSSLVNRRYMIERINLEDGED